MWPFDIKKKRREAEEKARTDRRKLEHATYLDKHVSRRPLTSTSKPRAEDNYWTNPSNPASPMSPLYYQPASNYEAPSSSHCHSSSYDNGSSSSSYDSGSSSCDSGSSSCSSSCD